MDLSISVSLSLSPPSLSLFLPLSLVCVRERVSAHTYTASYIHIYCVRELCQRTHTASYIHIKSAAKYPPEPLGRPQNPKNPARPACSRGPPTPGYIWAQGLQRVNCNRRNIYSCDSRRPLRDEIHLSSSSWSLTLSLFSLGGKSTKSWRFVMKVTIKDLW